jgi:hypothetical protein
MTATTSLSVFHQWLLADPASNASACAIIIHGDQDPDSSHLISDIAQYLNEYDDDGDGRWLPATSELVEKIARDANHRRLLGLDEMDDSFTGGCHNLLGALGRRGHVVFRWPGVSDKELDLADAFHAGVGHGLHDRCHIIVDPELMDSRCVARVIGDVFLEWLHSESRRNPSIRDIR